MRNEDPNIHIQRMHKYAVTLMRFVESGEITRESLGLSKLVQAGTVKYLELIGEEAQRLLKVDADFGESMNLVEMAGFRNRVVHAYDGVDWGIVEEATFDEVPELVKTLEAIATERGITLLAD